jgi:hypothetical protein
VNKHGKPAVEITRHNLLNRNVRHFGTFFTARCLSTFFTPRHLSRWLHIEEGAITRHNLLNRNVRHFSSVHGISRFLVYQGQHIEEGAKYDLILPSCTFAETEGFYINCLGMAQRAGHAVSVPGEAKTNENIISALFQYMFESKLETMNYSTRYQRHLPYLLNNINDMDMCLDLSHVMPANMYLRSHILVVHVRHYYETDMISRASTVLARLRTNIGNYIHG